MNRFVLDCSVAMCWCFDDEDDSYAIDLLRTIDESAAIVPSIWPLEVANAVLVGERRGRLTSSDTARALAMLSALPVLIDGVADLRMLHKVLLLARQAGVSSYDAAYLELALREGLPIATLDSRMRTAASELGIAVIQ